MLRRTLPAALLALRSLAQAPKSTLRGKLAQAARRKPALLTPEGRTVLLDAEADTLSVVNDARLHGMDMEAAGEFTAPDQFRVGPFHLRSLLVLKGGKKYEVTYWCEVCAIRTYTPGKCMCCQQETQLDLREPLMSNAQNYSATKTVVDSIEVVRLTDAAHKTEVSIVPSIGNTAYEMKVNGKNVFWAPYSGPGELKAKPAQGGNPFLAPWANRIDQDAFYANGKKYLLNPELRNWRRDQNQKPIHGLLVYSSAWQVVGLKADGAGAETTSRLEFWKHPDLISQFPFAHTITMTHRLRDGVLEVETTLENHSTDPMPVSLGYHAYYQLHDSPRDEWTVHVAARERMVLSNLLIPTGERQPVSLPDPAPLAGT
ncbi:MAG: aldose 1-epimerase, partial [Acidobacteriota bacterium]